jgi:hypothetical protein
MRLHLLQQMKRWAKLGAATGIILALALLLGIAGSRSVRAAVTAFVAATNTTAKLDSPKLVDHGARRVVLLNVAVGIPDGQSASQGSFTSGDLETTADYTVPAGQRLVIESISGEYMVPKGQAPNPFQFETAVGDSHGSHRLLPTLTHSDGIDGYFSFSSPLPAYQEPGRYIVASCSRYPSTAGVATCSATLSGHLESID